MAKTALIIIDMQTGMFEGDLITSMHKAETLLLNTRLLIDTAREAGLLIVYIQHCAYPDQVLIKGTEAWKIQPDIAPIEGDIVVLKRESSAFENTNLDEILQGEGVDAVITCGLQSEFCVTNTSVAAQEHGYSVTVAKDCHSTFPNDKLLASDIVIKQNDVLKDKGATVLTVAELIQNKCLTAATL